MPNRPIRAIVQNQRVHTVPTNATVRTAAHIMKENKISSVMVVEGDRLAGIFTERDALFRVLAGGLDPDRTRLSDVMTPSPVTVDLDTSVRDALRRMFNDGLRHLPIVHGGRVVGVISMRDFMGEELAMLDREKELMESLTEVL